MEMVTLEEFKEAYTAPAPPSTYDVFMSDRAQKRNFLLGMEQPLDVAVLAVHTGTFLPRARSAETVVRAAYLRRAYHDETLPPQLHESRIADRGA